MGCNISKSDDSDVVLRCLKRKRLMKNAVNYRQDFAFAHLAYIQTLRNVGHALCDFSERELSDVPTSGSSALPALSSPQSSLPAVGAVSPPLVASALPASPAPVSPSLKPAKPPVIPPQESPRSSPGAEARPSSPFLNGSSPYRGEQSGDFSPPFYSPARGEFDNFPIPYASPRRSTFAASRPISRNSGWDPFDLFYTSPIPYQHIRTTNFQEEEDNIVDFDQVMQEEGMPDLEEEDRQDYEKEQPQQNEEQRHEDTTAPHSEDQTPELIRIQPEKVLDKVEEKQGGTSMFIPPVEKEGKVESKKAEKGLTELVRHIDYQFGKASDSGKELSGVLETQMIHRHGSILDKRDASRVFNAIIRQWSRKATLRSKDIQETDAIAECGMAGSHSSTLERLYMWEKKLYAEVKSGEQIRIAFDKKRKQLNSLEGKVKDQNLVEKTRVAMKSLDSELTVALRAVHAASIRIQQLTSEELYPQLAEASGGLKDMWKVMVECHETQKTIALEIQTLEKSKAVDEPSEAHRNATIKLEHELDKWQQYLHLWVSSQKKYIDVLLAWLRICHMEPDTNIKDGSMSPKWTVERPFIYLLVKSWHDALVILEGHMAATNIIRNFAEVLHALQLEESEQLIQSHRNPVQSIEKKRGESSDNQADLKDNLEDRRNSFRRMVEEKYSYNTGIHVSQEATLGSLQENLPKIFEAMASFSAVALSAYEKIHQDIQNCTSQPKDEALQN